MKKTPFNDNWDFWKFGNEQHKKSVTIPHDAMLSEKRSITSAGGKNTGWFEGYNYVYEKRFSLPPGSDTRHAILEFEGVYRNAEVFVNGERAAFRPYGYTNFYVNLTRYLHEKGDNVVRVIARNADQPNSRWYSGAGIYRPVTLWHADDNHILLNGVRIRTVTTDPPVVEIVVKTRGVGEVTVTLFDSDEPVYSSSMESNGQTVFSVPFNGAKLWSPDHPHLYRCRAEFGTDRVEENFGVRRIDCDAVNGFRINGKRVLLLGACVHHDNGILGACAYDFAEHRKVKLLKESGYNAIRSGHSPFSKSLLNACDSLGMFVMDEYVDGWYIHKTKYDYADYFDEWWRSDLMDMIDKDCNHPSVIIYSIGNEVSETAETRGIALAEEMTRFCREHDPSRYVTCGINIFFNYLSSIGFGVYSDRKADLELRKTAKSRAQSRRKQKAVGSEFFNNIAGLLGADFMKFGASLHGSDVRTRDAFAKLDIAGYNYGINRYRKDFRKYPNRVIVGSETFSFDAWKFYEIAGEHPALIGDFIWAGIDYLGEVGIGASEYKNYAPDFSYGPGWIAASQGTLDLLGHSQCDMAYIRVVYGLDDIRIGVVPADNAGEPHTPTAWRMTNAIESWSWNGCDGNRTRVEVYARAASVEIFINGISQGIRKNRISRRNCRFVFNTRYRNGELTAAAYDSAGREIARTSLTSAGDETILSIEPEKTTIGPDELAYVWLRYTDKNRVGKPLARGIIKVSVSGGRLLGLGSACPYNPDGYQNDFTDTYYGTAMAVVKPDGAVDINIFAESPFGNSAAIVRCETAMQVGMSDAT